MYAVIGELPLYGAVQAMVTPLLEFIEVDGALGVSGIIVGS